MMKYAKIISGVAAVLCWCSIATGQNQVIDTPHNLSTSGPGTVRAATEDEICIFCHTPHNSSAIQPIWNRNTPVSAYTIYQSGSLDAVTGQPTGSSKMCLSCHDGTIALGNVLSRDQDIQMMSGITTLPAGATNLSTDLSDDHPISFPYDANLISLDPNLVDPSQLPPPFKLDANSELQCTTCHDAHDNSFGSFLVTGNTGPTFCKSCHDIPTANNPEHELCSNCHTVHTSPSGPYLLTQKNTTDVCMVCHNYLANDRTGKASKNGIRSIARGLQLNLKKLDVHVTNRTTVPINPGANDTTCTDCHNPHTMERGIVQAPIIQPVLGDLKGVSSSGAVVLRASNEYEVCFRCHADNNVINQSYRPRVITQVNTRYEFALDAVSFHPIEGAGRNTDVPSLKPGWTESSVMYCSDCHGSDTSKQVGGTGANGVHGSDEEPLLLARYETADSTHESPSAYALCYNCHYRNGVSGLLSDISFPHRKHLEEDAPCSACHDPHGISSAQGNATNNAHLINFDTSIVSPDPITGLLKYESTGRFRGQCYLECHGKRHSPKRYPERGRGGRGRR